MEGCCGSRVRARATCAAKRGSVSSCSAQRDEHVLSRGDHARLARMPQGPSERHLHSLHGPTSSCPSQAPPLPISRPRLAYFFLKKAPRPFCCGAAALFGFGLDAPRDEEEGVREAVWRGEGGRERLSGAEGSDRRGRRRTHERV